MSDALNRCGNSFTIGNAAFAKLNIKSETLRNNTFQYLKLYFTHKLKIYFTHTLIPDNAELRILLLKLTKNPKSCVYINCFRKNDFVRKKRL